jgi:hypothetical protein
MFQTLNYNFLLEKTQKRILEIWLLVSYFHANTNSILKNRFLTCALIISAFNERPTVINLFTSLNIGM